MHLMPLAAEAAGQSATAEAVLFWIFAVIGIGAGLAMITMKNIVHAALMLVLNFIAIAALYLALQSSFLGIVQIIVYAGAIMVLFLFVIMLLGVDRDDLLFDTSRWHKVGAAALTVLLAGALLFTFSGYLTADSACGSQAPAERDRTAVRCVGLDEAIASNENGAVGVVADRLFTRWTFPFEAASLLLVVATIGALVLGRRNDPDLIEHDAPEASAPQPGDRDVEALVGSTESTTDDPSDEHGTEAR
jgi:NADH-quinone oxidoreductase subunit J